MEWKPAWIVSGIAVLLAFALIVLATQKFRRSRGRNWKPHAIYAAVVVVVALVLPADFKEFLFSPLGVAVVGMVFPLFESLRALCTPSTMDDMEWLQYWVAMGGVFFVSAFFKDYKILPEHGQLIWFQFEFFFLIWLYLPFTDGSTLIFDFITRPLLSPIIDPVTEKMNSWIAAITATVINGSHLWFLWGFFVILPKDFKRFVTIAVGTVYPSFASVTAISTVTTTDDTFWLTYWACYGILFLIMDWTETFLGRIWGFYTVIIFSTVYLMLPMTQGAEKCFRHVLVPLAGLKENLLLRDALILKKDILASMPPDRQKDIRKLIAYSFDTETPDDDVEAPGALDSRIEPTSENARQLLSTTSFWGIRKRMQSLTSGGQQEESGQATENTRLV